MDKVIDTRKRKVLDVGDPIKDTSMSQCVLEIYELPQENPDVEDGTPMNTQQTDGKDNERRLAEREKVLNEREKRLNEREEKLGEYEKRLNKDTSILADNVRRLVAALQVKEQNHEELRRQYFVENLLLLINLANDLEKNDEKKAMEHILHSFYLTEDEWLPKEVKLKVADIGKSNHNSTSEVSEFLKNAVLKLGTQEASSLNITLATGDNVEHKVVNYPNDKHLP